ncbi:MAG: choline ABC transporter substrate-binding protein [Mesorhizobium sp.]|nr:MAG: choline ABC transporter substrate-binding protein [Mesorhizobium sp.]
MNRAISFAFGVVLSGTSVTVGLANEPPECQTVRIGSGGWTDNIIQDALAINVLHGLGYNPVETELGLNVLIEGLKNNDLDVHFDYWSPSSDSLMKPYIEEKSIEVIGANLTGTKYTIAVPTYAWEAGLKDFADLAKFKDQLRGKIYGQSAGSDSNNIVLSMISKNDFNLGNFELVESSEQVMLSQVDSAIKHKEYIAFIGWAPHPMNSKYDMKYLSGGDKYFGPNYGSATVYTVARKGLSETCPNLGRFLKNLTFTVDMENALMTQYLDNGADPILASRKWLKENPSVLDGWLQGVNTVDGKLGLPAVKAYMMSQ